MTKLDARAEDTSTSRRRWNTAIVNNRWKSIDRPTRSQWHFNRIQLPNQLHIHWNGLLARPDAT
eukprot:2846397-Amphidinium_carterae.1